MGIILSIVKNPKICQQKVDINVRRKGTFRNGTTVLGRWKKRGEAQLEASEETVSTTRQMLPRILDDLPECCMAANSGH